MSIQETVDYIRSFQSSPPNNEANTRLRVVDPTLRELGYSARDIDAEGLDVAGNKPDYAILWDSEHCWYLEAKAWNVALTDQHAAQSSGYTYQNGKRWAVLTNGRVWRLYDAHEKEPAKRLVCEAGIGDPQRLAELLSALRKEAVINGETEAFARRIRLHRVLDAHLCDEKSPVVKAIVTVLKKLPEPETIDVIPAEVVAYLQDLRQPPRIEDDAPGPASEPATAPPAAPVQAMQEPEDLRPIGSFRARYTKPAAILLPGQAETPVNLWVEVACCAMKWLCDHHSITLPFRKSFSDYPVLAATPEGLRSPKEIHGALTHCWYEAHRSANSIVRDIERICKAVGVDPGTIQVRLQQR